MRRPNAYISLHVVVWESTPSPAVFLTVAVVIVKEARQICLVRVWRVPVNDASTASPVNATRLRHG